MNKFDEFADMIMHRYPNAEALLALPFPRFILIANQGRKKIIEDRIHAQWCAQLPLMAQGICEYMDFEKYRKHVFGEDIDRRPTEVILAELDELEKRMEEKNGNGAV